jgi:hypothetical protein
MKDHGQRFWIATHGDLCFVIFIRLLIGIEHEREFVGTACVNDGRLQPTDVEILVVIAVRHTDPDHDLPIERPMIWVLGGELLHRLEELAKRHGAALIVRLARCEKWWVY